MRAYSINSEPGMLEYFERRCWEIAALAAAQSNARPAFFRLLYEAHLGSSRQFQNIAKARARSTSGARLL